MNQSKSAKQITVESYIDYIESCVSNYMVNSGKIENRKAEIMSTRAELVSADKALAYMQEHGPWTDELREQTQADCVLEAAKLRNYDAKIQLLDAEINALQVENKGIILDIIEYADHLKTLTTPKP